jgi:hypothetical protein
MVQLAMYFWRAGEAAFFKFNLLQQLQVKRRRNKNRVHRADWFCNDAHKQNCAEQCGRMIKQKHFDIEASYASGCIVLSCDVGSNAALMFAGEDLRQESGKFCIGSGLKDSK